MEIPLRTVLNDHVRGNSDQAAVWLLSFAKKSLPPFLVVGLLYIIIFQGQTKNPRWLVRTTPTGPCCDPLLETMDHPGCENDYKITISTAQ